MSLEALPFVHHIVYNVAHQICNGYYRKILFGRSQKKGEKTQPKKLQEVGVTFNYKRRVVSSIPVKETPKSITRYDIETKTLVIFTSKPPNSCHCPTDFKLWGSSNC